MEEWKDICGFEGLYQVSSLGRVKSLERLVNYSNGRISKCHEKILKPCLDAQGYRFVNLYRQNGKKVCRIHRLVALAFIPNPENKKEVNHKLGDKALNAVIDIEWVSRLENQSHAVKNGLHSYGEKRNSAVLTERIILEAKRLRSSGMKVVEIARKIGVNRSTINQAILGINWRRVS